MCENAALEGSRWVKNLRQPSVFASPYRPKVESPSKCLLFKGSAILGGNTVRQRRIIRDASVP